MVKISVIIPTYDDEEELIKEVLISLENQILIPSEIIFVNSGKNKIDNLIKNHISDNFKIKYLYVKHAYPGKARNLGVELSSHEWIAFLDSKTIPNKNWLKNTYDHLISSKKDIIFGKTLFLSKNNFQELIKAATYGNLSHETTPGTLLNKEIFKKNGNFIEHLRSSEDLEWRVRAKANYRTDTLKNYSLTYSNLPNDLIFLFKKYFIFSIHTAGSDVLKNQKNLYLIILLIISTIIIPKWNYIMKYLTGEWANIFYLPNITKIYILTLIIILFAMFFVNNFLLIKFKNNLIYNILKIVVFVLITISVYRWNDLVANWIEDTVFYIPHITKIYISLLFVFSLLNRGIYIPLKRKIKYDYLFPFNWIRVGLIGLCLDLIKAPGYIFGAIRYLIIYKKN